MRLLKLCLGLWGKDLALALHDLYSVQCHTESFTEDLVAPVREKLNQNGFIEWLKVILRFRQNLASQP